MKSQHTPNKPNRRKWLRDAAIATTSAAVLPSLLTGCTDHREFIVKGGLGSAPSLSAAEWEAAAQNLSNIKKWMDEVRSYNAPYVEHVYHSLKGGDGSNAADIFVDIVVEIATAMFEVVLEAVPGVGPLIGAAIAIAGMGFKEWEAERDRKTNIDATFANFQKRYEDYEEKVTGKILHLINIGVKSDKDYPYQNLKDKFKNGTVEFLNKTYSPRELAYANFPCSDNGCNTDLYAALRDAAILGFKKFIWKTMIIELGDFHSALFDPDEQYKPDKDKDDPVGYARKMMHTRSRNPNAPDYSTIYIGVIWPPPSRYNGYENTYDFRYWYFTFGSGGSLSADAADELFKDDTPGNIINKDGLFTRDCVFKQFHKEKQLFYDYRDLGTVAGMHYEPRDNLGGVIGDTLFMGAKSKDC